MKLTTHVLDIATGLPASGLRVDLAREDGSLIVSAITNADGRVDKPLLEGATFRHGVYVLTFHVGAYLRAQAIALPDPAFLDLVPIRFGIAQDRHYHVPLLLSPYGYSTYRGS